MVVGAEASPPLTTTSDSTTTTSILSSPSGSSSNKSSSEITTTSSSSTTDDNSSKHSLIVNYLPQSIKQREFYHLFSKIGPLKSCKLMFDKETGYSYGYGFIEYTTADHAEQACKQYNGYQIEHKRLKVAYARPQSLETRNTTLYIKNIPCHYDESVLDDLFAKYGKIIQTRVIRDQDTQSSRGIGFVIMETRSQAQQACQELDGTIPKDGQEQLVVKFTDPDSKRRNMVKVLGEHYGHGSEMNAAWGMSPQYYGGSDEFSFDLINADKQYQISTLTNSNDKTVKRFRSNRFDSTQQWPASSSTLASAYYEPYYALTVAAAGTALSVGGYPPPSYNQAYDTGLYGPGLTSAAAITASLPQFDNSLNKNIGYLVYVYGIGQRATQQELVQLFQQFGRVLKCDIIIDFNTGLCKGFAFVAMERYQDAQMAIQNLNRMPFHGRTLQVRFKTQ
ncbi:unnamed protein product [Didymodactylos carnosus]|uniref:RRM domain-containing protein n=2 Tax=Didymodactylos carnosus TaxID=1234261 RepID=A0A813WWB5_9BILA|nr:unnamed protein product [Didymodactylos carnosus]CAF3649180.1 unnamed protein product [Didymodactylos carnosus]